MKQLVICFISIGVMVQRNILIVLAAGAILFSLGNSIAHAQSPDAPAVAAEPAPPQRTLIVGTRHVPPFAIKNSDDTWSGIAIDLWRNIAAKLNIKYELREMGLQEMLDAVRDGKIDVAAAAITVTAEREAMFDFTHPFFTTGLGIAARPEGGSGIWAVMQRIFSLEFLGVVAFLLAVLIGVGTLVWLFERKHNQAQFGGSAIKGIGNGLWYSAVTMTTVGYGDKSPVTLAGRIVGFIWMFAAIIIISSFTAMITSALTVSNLNSSVRGPQDLPRLKVVTVANATSDRYLTTNRIRHTTVDDVQKALAEVATGKADAAVYDAPVMQYFIQQDHSGALAMVPGTFDRQDYALALPRDSVLRKPITRELVEQIRSEEWMNVVAKYLGE